MNIVETLRQFRVFDFAVFDFALSYIGIFLFSPILTKLAKKLKLNISRAHWLWLTLPISIITHLLFNIPTPLLKMFLDPSGGYVLKIVVIFMTYMGLKDIKKV